MYPFIFELRALQALDNGRGCGAALALEFLALTAARSGEVRHARWSEIDRKDRSWTIPAERTKTGRSHRAPLTTRAMEILDLQRKPKMLPDQYIFPGRTAGKNKARPPLSDATLRQVMRRMKIDAVSHGPRSRGKDWSMVRTEDNEIASELALSITSVTTRPVPLTLAMNCSLSASI